MIMCEINFLPVCSRCNNVLRGETIDYESHVDILNTPESEPITKILHNCYEITPHKCPFCGEHFETITIPTKLPFETPYLRKD